MFYPPELLSWIEAVSTHLPALSRSQAQALALYSFAATVTPSCGISHVAYFLAQLLHKRDNSVRQRLREQFYDAADKRGRQRRQVEVEGCFAPLLAWLLRLWHSEEAWLVLDATTLRQAFTVLSVSVVVGACAIPVAWAVLPATQPGAWQPHWLRLLNLVLATATRDQHVLVLADRGLYAKWLFEQIVAAGAHPLLRINRRGSCCVLATGQRLALRTLAQLSQGRCWHGTVVCFQGKARLRATLLVLWDTGQQDAWLLLTDGMAEAISPTWYALRAWIEAGFKALQSGGFDWQRTRMRDPRRAERLWLVLALATLRALATTPASAPPARQALPSALRRPSPSRRRSYPRLSRLKCGLLAALAALVAQRHLPPQRLQAPALPPAPMLEFLHLLNTYP